MTSVQSRGCLRQERLFVAPSVALFGSFPPAESDDNISDQLAEPPKANLPVAVILATALPVPKYTKKDLQRILKIVLEARTPTISEEP